MIHRRIHRRDYGGLVLGGILLVVGIYYLARNTLGFNLDDIDWEPIWPFLVIALGVVIVIGALSRREPDEPQPPTT